MTTKLCNNQQSQKASLGCLEILEEKSQETLGTLQEMTMMQLRSESTNLSGSSKTDTMSEQRIVDACDEDPDSILAGKKTNQQDATGMLSDDEPLTYWDVLKNQTSSVWDLLSGDPLSGIDPNEVLKKPKHKKPNPRPYISFNDLNNSDDAPYENKPKPAIEIGIAFDF